MITFSVVFNIADIRLECNRGKQVVMSRLNSSGLLSGHEGIAPVGVGSCAERLHPVFLSASALKSRRPRVYYHTWEGIKATAVAVVQTPVKVFEGDGHCVFSPFGIVTTCRVFAKRLPVSGGFSKEASAVCESKMERRMKNGSVTGRYNRIQYGQSTSHLPAHRSRRRHSSPVWTVDHRRSDDQADPGRDESLSVAAL